MQRVGQRRRALLGGDPSAPPRITAADDGRRSAGGNANGTPHTCTPRWLQRGSFVRSFVRASERPRTNHTLLWEKEGARHPLVFRVWAWFCMHAPATCGRLIDWQCSRRERSVWGWGRVICGAVALVVGPSNAPPPAWSR